MARAARPHRRGGRSPARSPSCSACSPCCSRRSRRPAASASPAPSASSSRRRSRSSCCRPRWCSSVAGSSGRGCPTSATPCWSTPTPRSGTASATPSPAGRAPSSSAPSLALAVLASGTLSISTGLDPADQFLQQPEAISAAERLGESFPAGTSDPVQVVTRDEPEQVLAAVEEVDGVDSARVTPRGDGVARIDAVPDAEPGSDAAQAVVVDVRAAVADFDDTHVGGGDAEALDASDYAARDRLLDPAADPAAGAGRAAAAAALGRRAAAAGGHRRRDVRRQHGRLVVALPRRLRLRRDGHRRAAAGVPVPGRARRRLQHLPRHPGPRGGARARHPRRACSAR